MAEKRFRTAIIGLGFIGPEHYRNLGLIDNVDRVAVCDPENVEAKAAKAKIHVPHLYSDWRAVIDNKNIDAVHVCAPNDNHKEIVLAALDAGKHVICEKPLASSAADTKEMVLAAQKAEPKGIRTMVNFNYTGHQLARYAKYLVQTGQLGKLRVALASYFQDWLQHQRDFSPSRCMGESCAWEDIGSHGTDMVLYVSGQRPTELMADLVTYNKVRDKPKRPLLAFEDPHKLPPEEFDQVDITTDDYAHVIMLFDNDFRANVTATQVYAGKKNDLTAQFIGATDSYAWDQTRPDEALFGHRFKPNEALDRGTLSVEQLAALSIIPPKHPIGYGKATANQFAEFYESAASGKTIGDYPTFMRGHNVACITDAVLCSKRQGGIKVPVSYLGLS
ncbi:MAG: Gfo/Idh/MocA family oxidoreductase [Candidatus Aenigmarchaeota archaeon]|nr:Gfo/Idh/MocA family oxidoreductase [Candidatus Aenigmarchaeota archaeon]